MRPNNAVWAMFSFFESFLTTQLTWHLKRIIKEIAQQLERPSLVFLVLLYPYQHKMKQKSICNQCQGPLKILTWPVDNYLNLFTTKFYNKVKFC